MILRSFLFVPADSEKKLAKARGVAADALILDLEDSVAPDHRVKARGLVREFLKEQHAQSIWVRINPSGTDLSEIAPHRPDGFVIPKVADHDALYGHDYIAGHAEKALDIPQDTIKFLPIVTETPEAVMSLTTYRYPPLPRLFGLTWGAEDLSAELGATSNREPDGEFTFIYKVVRAHTLIAAKAAGRHAIETLHADFRDVAGLERAARAAHRDGFSGMLAIHPDQVPVINAAFTPSAEDIAHAERVVAAFAGGDGVVNLDGKMLDQPHLKQAQHVLQAVKRWSGNGPSES